LGRLDLLLSLLILKHQPENATSGKESIMSTFLKITITFNLILAMAAGVFILEFKSENRFLVSNIRGLEGEKANLEDTVSLRELDIKGLEQDVIQLQEKMANLNIQLSQANITVRMREADIDEEKAAILSLKEEVALVRRKLELARVENTGLDASISEQELTLSNLKLIIVQLTEEHQRMEEELIACMSIPDAGKSVVESSIISYDEELNLVIFPVDESERVLQNAVATIHRGGNLQAKARVKHLGEGIAAAILLDEWRVGPVGIGDSVSFLR